MDHGWWQPGPEPARCQPGVEIRPGGWRLALLASTIVHALVLGAGQAVVVPRQDSTSTPCARLLASPRLEPGTIAQSVTVGTEGLRVRGAHAGGRAILELSLTPAAKHSIPRPDTGRPGRGGTATAREQAVNLSNTIDGITLERAIPDNLESAQVARVRWQSEEQPTVEVDREREPPAKTALRVSFEQSGARRLARPEAVETRIKPARLWATSAPATVGTGPTGLLQRTPPRFVPASNQETRRSREQSLARDHRQTGTQDRPRSEAFGPPPTARFPSELRDDSTLGRSSGLVQSLIDASTAGGLPGPGSGGQAATGPTGSGGESGPGTRSSPGGGQAAGSGDNGRLTSYFRALLRRLEPHWRDALPSWAMERGLGALATIGLVLLPDGSVAEARVLRPSGIAQYDENLLAAIRRAAPYDPVPRELVGGPLRVRVTFDATNPVVGRSGPGPGRRHK